MELVWSTGPMGGLILVKKAELQNFFFFLLEAN
jgi:hypothetical protein